MSNKEGMTDSKHSVVNMPIVNMLMVNRIVFSIVLMAIQINIVQPAFAGQCFSDPKDAYAYLMRQESRKKQTQATIKKSIKVNINTATEAQLTSLTGIGSHKAQAIILYRDSFGSFDKVDDLTNVKGIGKKTVEKNRSRLTIR